MRRLKKRIRDVSRGYKGVEKPPRWPRMRARVLVARLVTYVGAALLIGLVARSLLIVFGVAPGKFPFGIDPDSRCRQTGYSCGVANSILMTFLTLAFAAAAFYFLRLRRVRTPYVKLASTKTAELVPTAGTIVGEVVGRDEVCHVIMDDLRDDGGRRPHVVLGGVGVGKTAVLYRLTKLLAENGAVPVPVRLRDAEEEVDFTGMAKRQFVRHAATASISDAEAERVWRELCKDGQVVVLADGLEEALSQDGVDGMTGPVSEAARRRAASERDNQIRLAIRRADIDDVPLVIASRPHDALVGLDAAVIELEHLGDEAALAYIQRGLPGADPQRLNRLIDVAEVTETPLFLRIARELHEKGLLAHPHRVKTPLETRGSDRAALRVRLLEMWIEALIEGHFHAEVPMAPKLREATVAQLGALACIGLGADRLEVSFTDLLQESDGSKERYRYSRLLRYLESTVEAARHDALPGSEVLSVSMSREVKLAAARGLQLRLVEPLGHGVRFPHSILQAYLGSRVIGLLIADDPSYLRTALENAGRELLIALVMFSRTASSRKGDMLAMVRTALREAARTAELDTAKKLDTLVAALEVDCVDVGPEHEGIAADLRRIWPPAFEDRTVEETKLKSVARYAESARTIARRVAAAPEAQEPRPEGVRPAYRELFTIARSDLSYRVRLAAAQELGDGGDAAYETLRGYRAGEDGFDAESYLPPPGKEHDWRNEDTMREFALRAWLAPMLAGSTVHLKDQAHENLRAWYEYVAHQPPSAAHRCPLSLQVALGQGFKLAANRRPDHPFSTAAARASLAELAAELLETTHFWFSRVTLLQALCLWALAEMPAWQGPERRRGSRDRRRSRQTPLPVGRAANPRALVEHWLATTNGGAEHPFVAEAGELAILALEQRQPERFLWIDESEVATKIGAPAGGAEAVRKYNLWIPSSVGWSALHPRAQKLVADMLLFLNLIERNDVPLERERRMRKAMRDALPPCLTGERVYLDPSRTVGLTVESTPGINCRDDCPFDFCPYPPKGTQPYRVELSEAFCRRQQVLLGKWWRPLPRRTASWQGAAPGELRRFWKEMERRARR